MGKALGKFGRFCIDMDSMWTLLRNISVNIWKLKNTYENIGQNMRTQENTRQHAKTFRHIGDHNKTEEKAQCCLVVASSLTGLSPMNLAPRFSTPRRIFPALFNAWEPLVSLRSNINTFTEWNF